MSIDSLYENVIHTLTTQGRIKAISEHVLSLSKVDAKVLYIFQILKEQNAFPTVLKVGKCEKISSYYRNLGNQKFKHSENFKAWQYYNLALLYAPLCSECYSTAISNRSAVLFSLEKWSECIQDIDNVFTMKYRENIKERLNKRKTACMENLVHQENGDQSEKEYNFLTLQDPLNPRFPCASSKLEVVFSKEMGRHVVAKTDIKVGEVLVKENPYFTLLLKTQYLFSCSYCLSRSPNLLPCDCCCFALYCSIKCKENARRDYHEIECPLMATLVHMEFTKLELLALRTIIKARNDHSDWESLLKTIQQAEENADTEFRGHVKVNNEWVYDSKYYLSIHTLASNVEKRSVSDIFQKAVTACVFLCLLQENTTFLNSDNEDEIKKIRECVAVTLFHHTMTSPTNMHGISTNVQNIEGNYVNEFSIASAPYAFHSLLNHSCAPNVVRFSKLGTGSMTLIALRPIKKGMQLFDNYGAHHAINARESRQQQLKYQYKFTCLCEACVNDWPDYMTMMMRNKRLPAHLSKRKDTLLNSVTLEKLQKGDVASAEKLIKPMCKLAEELEPYAPCMELADCQETLKQCLQILYGVVPYGYSDLVDWSPKPPNV